MERSSSTSICCKPLASNPELPPGRASKFFSRSIVTEFIFYTLDMVNTQSELAEVDPPPFWLSLTKKGDPSEFFLLALGNRAT